MKASERPPRLHEASTLVVWASQVYTIGQKVVWWRHWRLDQGGVDGCYADCAALARGLAMQRGTVEKYRTQFQADGTMVSWLRPEGRNRGWACMLPAPFLIWEWTKDVNERALRLAAEFDAYLRSRNDWARAGPSSGSDQNGDTGETRTAIRVAPESPSGSHPDGHPGMGGKGGAPSSASVAESQLRPQEGVRNPRSGGNFRAREPAEGGVFARANDGEAGTAAPANDLQAPEPTGDPAWDERILAMFERMRARRRTA